MSIRYELNITRQWYKRKIKEGIRPSADTVRQLIRSSWPGLSEEEHEQIFQACNSFDAFDRDD